MLADTAAVRALGRAGSLLADDIAVVAARLASLPVADAADALGPICAPFLAALTQAVARESVEVAALGRNVRHGGATAHASADAYESADANTEGLLAVPGWL